MNVLFDDCLIEREFGTAAVQVAALHKWAKQSGIEIPQTVPTLEDFDAVHIETLLCAIERAVPSMSDYAGILLANKIDAPELRGILEQHGAPIARWLVPAEVHRLWRYRLREAIGSGEFMPVDALTGLPLAQGFPTGSSTAETAPEKDGKHTDTGQLEHWKMRVQAEATTRFKRLRAAGASPTVNSIKDDLAKWCRDNDVKTSGHVFPSSNYLRTHVLSRKHWSPPR